MKKKTLVLIVSLIITSAVISAIFYFSSFKAADDNAVVSQQSNDVVNDKAIDKTKIKIGVLYISDPAEGAGYTYTHDLGIQEMQKILGLKDEQILIKKNIADDNKQMIEQAAKECIDAGCRIIFATSFGYMDTIAELAEKNPNVYFSHASGYKSNGKNFNNYFGRIYQPRYLSGIAAGMKTKSNKIGYVAAMDSRNSEVTGGIDAFAMGVYAVNQQARVYVKITDSWYAPDKEAAATAELLAVGCDVMSQHCDTAYPLEMAEDKGVWGIGYNSDMRRQTPNAALVSVVWNWGAYYSTIVQKIIDGTWNGSNYYGGMQEGIVGITELSDANSPETKEKVEAAAEKILNGSLLIFNNEIITNTGAVVGTKGKVFTDADITGNIHWYFRNIIVMP